MHTEFLGWGLQMTVVGMGLVFAMLALLWLLLTVILAIDKPGDDEEEAPEASADESEAASESQPASAGLPGDLVAAITAAVLKHKSAVGGGSSSIVRTTWSGNQQSNWVVAGRARQTNTWTPRGK